MPPAGGVLRIFTNHTKREPTTMRTFLIVFWGVDAFGALVRVEYFDSAQPENAWVKVLVTDEGARVRAVCVYGVQDEAKTDSQSAEFASAVEDAQAWLGQRPESMELEGVTLVPVSTSVFSYDGNDSRLLQVSSDGSGSSLTYGAAGFVNSVASWGSADDSAVSFSLLCASTDGRVLAVGGASAGVPEFGVPSTGTGAGAGVGSVAGFDASVMHPLVWDENLFVPRVLGVAGSSMPSVGSLVPGAGSGAGLLDPYGWDSLGVVAPAVPSAQGAGGAPVLPDSLVGVSAASGVVLGATGFEVLGARVVDSRVARFTAPDPLPAPVGAGWGADPFSLVGGNPVSLVDPWGLSPVSVEDFNKFREERIRNQGAIFWARALQIGSIALTVAATIFLGPVGGIVAGAIAGAMDGAASALEKTKNGEIDGWNVAKEAGWGLFKGVVTGTVAKVFTHAKVFARPFVNGRTEGWMSKISSKVTSNGKVASWVRNSAEKASSFIGARKQGIATAVERDGKNIWQATWKGKDVAWNRMQNAFGKHAPEIIGDTLSAGVGGFMDYTKNAENFKMQDAAVSFTSAATFGFYKSGVTKGIKIGVSDRIAAKTEASVIDKIKENNRITPEIKKEILVSSRKQSVVNDLASPGASALFDPMDKAVQREMLNDSSKTPRVVSPQEARDAYLKDLGDSFMGNPKSNLKSMAGAQKSRNDALEAKAVKDAAGAKENGGN